MGKKQTFPSDNFIMTPKSIIDEYDLTTAALFGLIWSFSQMQLGYCKLSQSQMAEKLGFKTRCINNKFKNLKDADLIKIIKRERFPDGGVLLHVVVNEEMMKLFDINYKAKLEKSGDATA